MFPTDKGESVSEYVSKIIKVIDRSGFEYQLTPMGTIIETEKLSDATNLIDNCYQILADDCDRVYCSAKLDIRKGELGRMKQKIESIENRIGVVKK